MNNSRIKKVGKTGNRFLVLDSIDGEPFSIVSRASTRELALAYIERKSSDNIYFIYEIKRIEKIQHNINITYNRISETIKLIG